MTDSTTTDLVISIDRAARVSGVRRHRLMDAAMQGTLPVFWIDEARDIFVAERALKHWLGGDQRARHIR